MGQTDNGAALYQVLVRPRAERTSCSASWPAPIAWSAIGPDLVQSSGARIGRCPVAASPAAILAPAWLTAPSAAGSGLDPSA